MSPGTIIRLPDGREGTIVYHSLDGYGFKWGRHSVRAEDIHGRGGLFSSEPPPPDDYQWEPEAMLRDPYPSADLECVGEDYEIVRTA